MRKKGFTIIELLVVIAVIGTLATIVIGSVYRARTKAVDVAFLKKAKELQTAIEVFNLDNNRYPSSGNINVALTGYPVASNCADNYPNYQTNWDTFIADVGDYLPEEYALIDTNRPICFFYTIHPNNFCGNTDPYFDYVITFGAEDTIYDSLENFVDSFGDRYFCLTPL